jgi:cytochrome b561
MLAFTYAVGVAGVLQDCRPWLHEQAWLDFHILFGILLLLTIFVQFAERKNESPMHAVELRKFRGHLVRSVYLVLYVLFGVGQFTIAGSTLQVHGVSQMATPDLSHALREYLVCGIVGLLAIHLLSALERRADHQHDK